MTSRVEICALGHDVEVLIETMQPVPGGLEIFGPAKWNVERHIVANGEKRTFYVYKQVRIASIKEVPNND